MSLVAQFVQRQQHHATLLHQLSLLHLLCSHFEKEEDQKNEQKRREEEERECQEHRQQRRYHRAAHALSYARVGETLVVQQYVRVSLGCHYYDPPCTNVDMLLPVWEMTLTL